MGGERGREVGERGREVGGKGEGSGNGVPPVHPLHFKQTNILLIKRHQDYKITNRRDHACIFRAFLVTSHRFYFTKINFLRRRCREINNKLDMTLNIDVSGLA